MSTALVWALLALGVPNAIAYLRYAMHLMRREDSHVPSPTTFISTLAAVVAPGCGRKWAASPGGRVEPGQFPDSRLCRPQRRVLFDPSQATVCSRFES